MMSTEFPVYKKQLPQIWIEDNNYIIESPTFRYVVSTTNKQKRKSADPLKILFALCKRMDVNAINSTYAN